MDPNRQEDPLDIDASQVSEDDREEILGEIDRVIQSGRTPLEEELADVRPRKKGGVFPIAVNVAAAALVAGGVFLLSGLFRLRNENITVSSAGFVSAEGGLLETLRQESEGLLEEKEAQIASIEERLERMDEQTAALRARLDSDVRSREEELRARVAEELAAERARLRAEGTPDAALERRLREFEREREAALSSDIVQYKNELESALQAKAQELTDSRRELRDALQLATEERAGIEARLSAQEAELRAQFDREREVLRQEATAAEQRLSSLQEARQREQLLTAQLEGYYREILRDLDGGDYVAAKESLGRLQALLDSPAVIRVPALLERRSLDQALSGALAELLRLRTAPAPSVSLAAPAAAAEREATAALAEEAQRRTDEITTLRREIDTLERTISGLRAAARQRSAGDSASARERIAELELQGARLSADLQVVQEEKAKLERRLSSFDALSSRYGEVRSRVRRLISQGDEASLREARRLLLQVLQDPAAAGLLPGMGDNLEEIDRSVAEGRVESGEARGREAALTDVLRYLTYLSRGIGGRDAETQVMAAAREDPLYRAVVREIQILRAGGAGTGELASAYLLLGTVVSVSGSQVVVEPLGDQQAVVGAPVQVRRSDALEQEQVIARGSVEQVRGGKVYARVETILAAGLSPQSRDLVYIGPR